MTSANPQHARTSALVGGWRGFRHWRRARPFWGGLLTIIAGLEIFGTTQMSLGGLTFQMGPTGFLSWLIPTILVACGMLMWVTPQHRMFYAIIASVTAVFSLIAVNLGGFFIGLLLGMVGGGLGFAWARVPVAAPTVEPAEDDSDEDGQSEEDLDDTAVLAAVHEDSGGPVSDVLPKPRNPLVEPVDQESASEQPGYDGSGQIPAQRPGEPPEAQPGQEQPLPRRDPPLLAITLVLLSLSATGVASLSRGAPALAAPACPPAVQPSVSVPMPTATPSSASKDGAEDGNLLTDILDGIADALGIGEDEEAAPAAEPAPTATGDPAAEERVAAAATPTATGDPGAAEPATGSPTPTAVAPTTSPTPTGKPEPTRSPSKPGACPGQSVDPRPGPGGVKRLVAALGQPLVAKKSSLLTGSKVTMYGLKLDGIIDLPTAGGGTVEVLQFSMKKAVTDDFLLQVPGPAGKTMRFRTDALTVQGDVKFYTSRFVGWIGPLKLTLTPSSPIPPDGIPLAVPKISFTNPEVQLAFVDSNVLTGRPTLEVSLA